MSIEKESNKTCLRGDNVQGEIRGQGLNKQKCIMRIIFQNRHCSSTYTNSTRIERRR